jgi:hypothetical protein
MLLCLPTVLTTADISILIGPAMRVAGWKALPQPAYESAAAGQSWGYPRRPTRL